MKFPLSQIASYVVMIFAAIAYSIPASADNSNSQTPKFVKDNFIGVVNSAKPIVSTDN